LPVPVDDDWPPTEPYMADVERGVVVRKGLSGGRAGPPTREMPDRAALLRSPAVDGSCPSPVEVLRASGVEHVVSEHPPIHGQADVERILRLPPDRLLKTVVFRRARGGYVLVALPAASRVSYPRLAAAVGIPRAEPRQAEPEDLV
jgi:hypothetical protein